MSQIDSLFFSFPKAILEDGPSVPTAIFAVGQFSWGAHYRASPLKSRELPP